MKAPKIIYLQTCGSCENYKCAPAECQSCEIDNPIDPDAVTWSRERVFETDAVYVSLDVLTHIYKLIKDQKEFFKTKNSALKVDCKRREDGFIKWYEQNFKKGGAE